MASAAITRAAQGAAASHFNAYSGANSGWNHRSDDERKPPRRKNSASRPIPATEESPHHPTTPSELGNNSPAEVEVSPDAAVSPDSLGGVYDASLGGRREALAEATDAEAAMSRRDSLAPSGILDEADQGKRFYLGQKLVHPRRGKGVIEKVVHCMSHTAACHPTDCMSQVNRNAAKVYTVRFAKNEVHSYTEVQL